MMQISKLKSILSHYYPIEVMEITPLEPGWAALAYKVHAEDGKMFFLKIYDKGRHSIAYILDAVPTYLFFIDWLNSNTPLKGKISRLFNTKDGSVEVEDEGHIYIMMEYIAGDTLGEKELTQVQVEELADIVAKLHAVVPPMSIHTESITERFKLSWLNGLREWLTTQLGTLKPEIQDVLAPYLDSLIRQVDELEVQGELLPSQDFSFALCHTDIHNWNIIANEDQKIHLIDWEGIRYAPVEADIFGIYQEPYFPEFLKYYQKSYPSYEINKGLLRYYTISRNMTDLWEGIEQLQFEELASEEYQGQLNGLKGVCEENAVFIKAFQ